ncbi:MoxR family ATPase [Rhodococcus antarcticus]|uniref:MoxR family ATPase n=1 Tax=Rhodococcus antarcticus TaxID=2987751 RepID=A0ABY6NZH1_9NOCA|nr:MoxR family ATPase [Rhodococcus antarcticus]UZJ24323.1 MoxR family ATPase [Rhodococcus antarcticus]
MTLAQPDFASVDDVVTRFAEHGYIADHTLATTVFLQTRLDKPVLLEGPAGVGKTELAKTLAEVTGRRLLRLQCYEGQDETKALYEWDYGKQLLYTQVLKEKIGQLVADADSLGEAVDRIAAQESVFFSERFLAPRPLLEAIRSEQPVVLLVDEVDRADEALEAVLLELLGENQVSVPELGTFTATTAPYVVLTSNNTRDLSAALKRRCLHMFLDYPSAERELEIVRTKETGLTDALATQLVDVVRGLRELELRKSPSISETIDWARTLAVLGATELTAKALSDTVNVVVKYEKDVRRAIEALPRLVDPNATLDEGPRGHGHGHGGHDEHPSPSAASVPRDPDDAEDSGPRGKDVRAGKDAPGRHDDGYYGAVSSPTPAGPATTPPGTPAAVRPSQGSRSFANGFGKKKAVDAPRGRR